MYLCRVTVRRLKRTIDDCPPPPAPLLCGIATGLVMYGLVLLTAYLVARCLP